MFEEVVAKLVFPIDFASQKSTLNITRIVLLAFALLATVVGFFAQSLSILLVIYTVGILLTLLIVGPAYPCYNKQKLTWVKPTINSGSMTDKISLDSDDVVIIE